MNLRRLRNLDLNLLVALQALVQEENVTRAAQRVGIGQSAMSSALSRLRELFEDDLLVRAGRTMELTPRAKSLAQQVGDILTRVEIAVAPDKAFDPREADREFAITAGDYEQYLLLPPLLRRLAEEAPGVRIRTAFVSSETRGSLDRGSTDLWIVPVDRRDPAYPFEILIEDHWVLVQCARRRARKSRRSLLEEVSRAGLVLHDPPASGFPERPPLSVQAVFGKMPKIAALAPGLLTLPFLVAGTPYYAAVPERLARRVRREAKVRIVEPPELMPTNRAMQWHPRSDADPSHRWFRRILLDVGSGLD